MLNPESPPELSVAQRFNAPEPLSLGNLKGKVIVLFAFQMLCPGSLKHALPQAQRLAHAFDSRDVAIIGLHMVFENHKDMTPELLEPFLKQEHISIPVAVDAPNGAGPPKTMEAYGMQGTPTVLLFDRQGRLRRHYLGAAGDARLAAEIMAFALEVPDAPRDVSRAIEQRLASALVDPEQHDHEHSGDCCGGHHDHGHDHAHDHTHNHAHDHAHDHEHGKGCGDKH
ncbi:MAG: peroxiredoxin family protein [Hyphomicrobium sp.]